MLNVAGTWTSKPNSNTPWLAWRDRATAEVAAEKASRLRKVKIEVTTYGCSEETANRVLRGYSHEYEHALIGSKTNIRFTRLQIERDSLLTCARAMMDAFSERAGPEATSITGNPMSHFSAAQQLQGKKGNQLVADLKNGDYTCPDDQAIILLWARRVAQRISTMEDLRIEMANASTYSHQIREAGADSDRLLQIYALVVELFDGDHDRARLWLQTPNSSLNNHSPIELVTTGDMTRLQCFVRASALAMMTTETTWERLNGNGPLSTSSPHPTYRCLAQAVADISKELREMSGQQEVIAVARSSELYERLRLIGLTASCFGGSNAMKSLFKGAEEIIGDSHELGRHINRAWKEVEGWIA